MGTNDLESRAVWNYSRNDELDDLGSSFNEMAESIGNKVKTISSLHSEIQKELLVGKTIQSVLIPSSEISLGWVEVYGISKSSSELGGDYFKIFKRESKANEISIAIGDVSGHGVGSALLVSSIVAITSQEVTNGVKDTSKIITSINKQMSSLFNFERRSKIKYFTTSLFCSLRKRRNVITFSFANAGHLSPILIRDGKYSELVAAKNGLALGIIQKAKYYEESIRLKENDIILLYTDGLIEQENSAGIQFGINKLNEILSNKEFQTAKSVSEFLLNSIQEFGEGLPNNDDITLVAIKVTKNV